MNTPRPKIFLNLSNHSVEGWPTEQREAARALDLGEPADLAGGLPMVDPEADTGAVVAQAKEIVTRALERGAEGAFVSGEYLLSFALVALLQREGVRCFAATSRRETQEKTQADGSVQRVLVFRFVRWRAYPELGELVGMA